KRGAAALAAACAYAMGEHHRIDGAGTGARDATDIKAAIFEQVIEHTPCKGAMRAAALERDVGELDGVAASVPGARPRRIIARHEVSVGRRCKACRQLRRVEFRV